MTCVLVHGHGCYMYLCWEGMPLGTNWTWELLMRSLDKTWESCRAKGIAMPYERLDLSRCVAVRPRLWLQADNAPKELRNQYTGQMLCLLTQGNYFRCSSHQHLHVGHTHEDVDAALSLVTIAMREEGLLQTPADVLRCLERKLTPIFQRRGMQFTAEMVDSATWLIE